jgi:hypothetical protein
LAAALPVLALEVEVTSVHAADSGPTDAALDALRPRLRRLVSYRSFRIVSQEQRKCTLRNSEEFELPGGRWLHVTPRGMDDQTVMVEVRLLDGRRRLVDTQVRMRNRGVVFFGVGRDQRGGDGALIVVLKAEQ